MYKILEFDYESKGETKRREVISFEPKELYHRRDKLLMENKKSINPETPTGYVEGYDLSILSPEDREIAFHTIRQVEEMLRPISALCWRRFSESKIPEIYRKDL